jgi:hypothetical protein
MTDLEARLDQALKAGAAPARDPMFRILVLERRERTALRRRLATGAALALAAAVLAALGIGLLEALPDVDRLAAIAAAGALLTALLAAPHLGGRAALNSLAAKAAWTLRTLPRPRLWP